jgi:LysR family transcriptional regulator, glycine cleavage system transcriptional activator
MATILPSMTSLRAFEAAARHSSFTRAAQELNLTQTAISHRIRKLEELLGVKLFVRDGNFIRLTEPAHDYLHTVRAMILELSEATGRTMHRGHDRALYVGCMPTFAMKCLIPNLGDFTGRHKDVSLRFWTILSSDSLTRRDYDVAILYGTGDWPGFVTHKLCDEEIFPVCSPKLMEAKPRPRKPADLRRHTVIRTAFSFILQDDWPMWLEAAGEKDLPFANEITCDLLLPSIQAAIDGLGFAMGRSPLVDADLAAKTLVAPFALRLTSKSGFYIASPKDRADLPNVRLFRDWALARFGSAQT